MGNQESKDILRSATVQIFRRDDRLYISIRDREHREVTGRDVILDANANADRIMDEVREALDAGFFPSRTEMLANANSYPRAEREQVYDPETGYVWG